jgi:hypothetical protein
MPVPRQVLVKVHGNGALGTPENIYDLPEELESRIELLLLLIKRVIAVLLHKQDAIHCQFAGAQRERFADRFHDWKLYAAQAITDVRCTWSM